MDTNRGGFAGASLQHTLINHQGASILTGLGFTGFNAKGKSTWKGAANIDMMNIEFAPNFKILLDSWNIKTNVWLRECIYKRVTPKGKKPGFRSSMLTFTTSAIWVSVQSDSPYVLSQVVPNSTVSMAGTT